MKKTVSSIMGLLLLSTIACTGPNREAEKEVKQLRHYVDSVEQTHQDYYEDEMYWAAADQYYTTKQSELDMKMADLSLQAQSDYKKLKADYAALKAKYDAEKAKRKTQMTLFNSLYHDIKTGDDTRLLFMTPANAAMIYETFVTTVDNNKEVYSREDWNEIKAFYVAMNTRKDTIEKTISKKDNQKITGQKVKFVAIKALNRPMSESEQK
jgi:hypothetical protein